MNECNFDRMEKLAYRNAKNDQHSDFMEDLDTSLPIYSQSAVTSAMLEVWAEDDNSDIEVNIGISRLYKCYMSNH